MLSSNTQPNASITHASDDKLSKAEILQEMKAIETRLTEQFQNDPAHLARLLSSLNELSEFELGRFFIKNKGALSGYWTWYIILGFNNGNITSPLEKFFVEKAPVVLATRERFGIFQKLLTQHIQSNSVVCSIPCGMMADLLTLKLPKDVSEVRFVGIDFDGAVFDLAKDLAKELKTGTHCDFFKQDAWALEAKEEYDVVTTNGLNIYEKDDSRVVSLYKGLHRALKPGGKLICSALTPPPAMSKESEWNIEAINQDDLATARELFGTIVQATWANFTTSAKTTSQLKEAGFTGDIEIHWDSRKMFPTFCATKPR